MDDTAMSKVFLGTNRLALMALELEHTQGDYPLWLNDPEINQFNSHAIYPISKVQCEDYVRTCQSDSRIVLAILTIPRSRPIYIGEKENHIGNIALQKIDLFNNSAELAILIGDKKAHGKGYGLEAARAICAHGFNALGLDRIYCGTHEKNIGMQKLALKLGMQEEGRSRKALFKNGEFADIIHYGILREEFCGKANG